MDASCGKKTTPLSPLSMVVRIRSKEMVELGFVSHVRRLLHRAKMSEEAFSFTLWACSAYAAVTPVVGTSNRCCPLLYLDPTYCQISSTLHISLSELEQVALNFAAFFASPALRPPSPASHRRLLSRHRRRRIGGSSAAIAGVASAAPRPSSRSEEHTSELQSHA